MNGKRRTVEIIDSRDMDETAHTEIFLETPAEEKRIVFLFHDRFPKTFSLDLHLRAPDTRAEIWFGIVGKGDSLSDISVRLFHEARNTFGRVIGKAALFDDARISFRGNLAVAELAQGADTYFLGRALMMSPKARAEICPYLEIKTSEVKASHGSSVGRVGERDLFYIRTRGVQESDAEKIFLSAFFSDVRALLPLPYRPILFSHESIA